MIRARVYVLENIFIYIQEFDIHICQIVIPHSIYSQGSVLKRTDVNRFPNEYPRHDVYHLCPDRAIIMITDINGKRKDEDTDQSKKLHEHLIMLQLLLV